MSKRLDFKLKNQRIRKFGDGFYFRVPKILVDNDYIKKDKKYTVILEENEE